MLCKSSVLPLPGSLNGYGQRRLNNFEGHLSEDDRKPKIHKSSLESTVQNTHVLLVGCFRINKR